MGESKKIYVTKDNRKYPGQQCQDDCLNYKFRRLHLFLVNQVINFCKSNNISIDEFHISADSLAESIKVGSWQPCTDSSLVFNKFNKRMVEFGEAVDKVWDYASYKYDFINSTIIPLSITISNYYDSPEDVKIQTLLHEMIHIEDYFWHPEHFIRNGKKITGHYYDAHGSWFMNEANRITKESGYKIANHVTHEEIGRSCLSVHSQRLADNKLKDARIIVASDNSSYWIFKTDIYKINTVVKLIKYQLPHMKKITEYTTNNSSLASRRSCNTKLSGWHYSKQGMMNFAEKYQFTTIKSYTL